MTDAWEDEEFEVPNFGAAPAAPPAALNWEDEEEYEPPPLPPAHGQAPTLSKDKQDKLDRQNAARKTEEVERALQDNETDGERRMRERQDVEEADHELTDELFANGSGGGGAAAVPEPVVVQGLDGYALKSLKDHIMLAHDVCDRFVAVKSKPNYVHAVLKELLKKLDDKLGPDELGELIGICAASKTAKEKAARQPTAKKAARGAANKPKGKSKAQIKAEAKEHEEMFGGFVEDEYENEFGNEYDDFM